MILRTVELQNAVEALIRQHGLQDVIDAVSRHARKKRVNKLPYNERLKQVGALMDEGLTSGEIALRLHLNANYSAHICFDVRAKRARADKAAERTLAKEKGN